MPKRSKGKFKPYQISRMPSNHEAEVFRNSSAVLDDTDPHESLKYMKDIFKDKLDENVITMIFSECAYNVDQAFETLISLCNDEVKNSFKEDEKLRMRKDSCHKSSSRIRDVGIIGADAGASNSSKVLNKSKLAINFSSPENPIKVPTANIENNIFVNNHPFEVPNQAVNLGFPYFLGTSDYAAFEPIPISESATASPSYKDFNKYFSTTYYTVPNNDCNTVVDVTNNASLSNENFTNTGPQFITPLLPRPLYKYGSPSYKSPTSELSSLFSGISKSIYTSSTNKTEDLLKLCPITETETKIKSGSRVLVILRGLPGSGKSTLGRKLKFSGEVFSTDDFFFKKGKYFFDPFKLNDAHAWNKRRTKKALEKRVTPIIIDNTNVEAWEIAPYVLMGRKFNYEVIILEPDTPWKFNVHELAVRNKHGVPKSKISKMKERYQHNITVKTILASVNLFNSENVDNTSSDLSLVENNISAYPDKSVINHILETVVVHKEQAPNDTILYDEMSIENDSSIIDTSNLVDSNLNFSFDSENASFEKFESKNDIQLNTHSNLSIFDNSVMDQSIVINDLDKLRALVREDSEDSQSHSSANDSSQDVSGWEAITEHDDDFLWSAFSKELNSSQASSNKNSMDSDNHEIIPPPANIKPFKTSISDISAQNSLFNSASSFCVDKIPKKATESADVVSKSDLILESNSFKSSLASECTIGNSLGSNYSFEFIDKVDVPELEKIGEKEDSALSSLNSGSVKKLWIDCEPFIPMNETSELSTTKSNVSPKEENKLAASFEHLYINEETDMNNISKILIDEPKPQRTNINILGFNKGYLESHTIDKNDNGYFMDTEKNCSEWDIENDTKGGRSTVKNEVVAETLSSTPKPQRQNLERTCSQTNEINDKNKYVSKKSFLNISIDAFSADWSFPEYVSNDTFENKNHNENLPSLKNSIDTQTEPSDFAFIYKISVGDDSINCFDYSVLNAKPYTSIIETADIELSVDNSENEMCLKVIKFDKSTSTDDVTDDIETSQKMTYLQERFSDISIEDLYHLLEICHNDETWVSNLLMDWGYKYNVQTENIIFNIEEKLDNEDIKSGSCESKVSATTLSNEYTKDELNEKALDILQVDSPSSGSDETEVPLQVAKHCILPSAGDFQKLCLVLDSAFAKQLEGLFGQVTSSKSNADRCVEIDVEFAQLLHAKWKNTVDNAKKPSKNGGEIKVSNLSYLETENNRLCNETSSSRINYKASPSLSEIMDMEYAIQLHKEEKLKKDKDFSTKLKRLELYNMFPGADTIALDEIFESNNYSLKDSVFALGVDCGQEETVQQTQNIEKIDECMIEWSKSNVFQEFENGDYSDWVYREDNIGTIQEAIPVVSSTISAEAVELRDLATKHYLLRQEFIRKAQTAYCRGMKDVASFYAQQGRDHGLFFKDANKRASALIAQQRNLTTSAFTLDLHGLYIQEAIPRLEKFLRNRKLDLKRRRQTVPQTISIVTGQGLHSMKGPKLRPSVLEYLKKTGYSFSEINPGMVDVTILPE